MEILLTKSSNLIEFDLENSFNDKNKETTLLSFTSKLMGFPESQRCIGNFFYCYSQISAKNFYVGKSVPLLTSNWTKSFIELLLGCCDKKQSILHLHYYPESKSSFGFITKSWLEKHFYHLDLDFSSKEIVKILRKDEYLHSLESDSSIKWGTKNFQELINIDLYSRHMPFMNSFLLRTYSNKDFISDDTDTSHLKNNLLPEDINKNYEDFFNEENKDSLSGFIPWKNSDNSINLSNELTRSIGTMSYYITGMGYKAPMISKIIKENCKCLNDMKICDYGGGYGLLLSELLLDSSLDISFCYLRDILSQNLLFFGSLYRYYQNIFKDKIKISLGSVQSLESFPSCSVAIFVGSLLYVPKSERKSVLDKIWGSLKLGGILIIHENIKHPSYTTDFDKMFTVEEIENLLSSYGEIIRYKSNYYAKVRVEDLQDRDTLFRVVIKN